MPSFRTPVKKCGSATTDRQRSVDPEQKECSPENIPLTTSVRRSVGEWEAGKAPSPSSTNLKAVSPKPTTSGKQTKPPTQGSRNASVGDRTAEARACLVRAKTLLNQSRNIKTEIKTEVAQAVERLYQLVKEGEPGLHRERAVPPQDALPPNHPTNERKLEELHTLLQENSRVLGYIKENMAKQTEDLQSLVGATKTYASAVAEQPKGNIPDRKSALHSIAVTSESETDTGEEVLTKIRHSLAAREEGLKVEKVRKARDGKVIVSCSTMAERDQVAERLKRSGGHLKVDEIKNRDPLLLLRDVLNYNTDEDILSALRKQNGSLFKDLHEADARIEIRFRKRTRNPHASHVIVRVSPQIWRRALEAGVAYIDLQKVKVEDQSPLVQCSQCLGYGHSRRFCKDPVERCSHCGGPHLRSECSDLPAGIEPSCCNCTKAKLDKVDHNAFSSDCPIRKKWDAIARASIAYC